MPTYLHKCDSCEQEFEAEYSIKSDPPDTCPLCNVSGKVKRLIAGGTVSRVELSGQELKQNIAVERKQMEKRFKTDINFKANIVGEEKFHKQQLAIEKLKKDL